MTRMRRFSALFVLLVLAAAPAANAATPKHGQLLQSRKITGDPALTAAGKNFFVKYRSVGVDGKPITVSGLVSLPKGKAPKKGWPVISYDHGTTGIADQCAPSRDANDNPAHLYNSYVYPLLNRWLKAGYAVVRTDYQGLGTAGAHQYLVGVAEGRSTLDIVRAARKLDKRVSNRFAIAGHSQGGHAALWAAKLAPSWTPDLKLGGTVAFAPASHISEQVAFVRAAKSPGGGLSAEAALIIRGIDLVDPGLNIPSLLSDKFAALYPETLTKCLPQLSQSDSIGGLAPSELFKEDADLSALTKAADKSDPENLKIKSPLDVEQGKQDTTVLPGLTDDLVKQLRGRGAKVVYKKYANTSHGAVVVSAADHATKYIKQHLR
jgi:pimeloyl-ACP methyl ester carboxylesterase